MVIDSSALVAVVLGEPEAEALLDVMSSEIEPPWISAVSFAFATWQRFGKGRHPAALSLGDCFSYALAKSTGQPLLFKGDDFSQTDLAVARP